MGLLDWLIVILPTLAVLYIAVRSRKYVRGVVDFLSAGRLCGRYVLLAGDMANGISILAIVMTCEQHYEAGFAVNIWNSALIPITLTLSLFGYCTYRFRETRAQSFGQFLELRYGSKGLRIFASTLRTFSELFAHAIMPAIAGRFFLYYLGFPEYITLFGHSWSVFVILMVVCVSMAIAIICCGGTLAIVITDAFQGMLCLPLIVFFTIYFLYRFNWSGEVVPVLLDRAPGQSFINPYDVLKLQKFNLITLVLAAATLFLHAASWIGGGISGAAISPHEQKMAAIMGKWRGSFSPLLYLLLSLAILVTLTHERFSEKARLIRTELSSRVACDIVQDPVLRNTLIENITAIPEQKHRIGVDPPLSQTSNLDTIYIDTARKTFEQAHVDNAAFLTQQFSTLYHQTMLAVTLRNLLGPGMMGLFCLLAILAMVSTDDSYIFSSVLTIVQDAILPFFKKPPSFRLHLWLFRGTAIAIGVMFILCSCFMAQLDYISLFFTITLSIWLGGCGPMITFGLYGRFGTRQGAWASMLTGMFLSSFFLLLQRTWASTIYPFLNAHEWTHATKKILRVLSAPLPLMDWKMNAEEFPINGFESYLLTLIITLLVYIAVSLLTCREKFNLEKLLHRGPYRLEPKQEANVPKAERRNLLERIAGITNEHTLGDKMISYSLVVYTYLFHFFICFVIMVIWNKISPWPRSWWGPYFLIVSIIVPAVTVAFTGVWFGIGSVCGLVGLFRRLKERTVDPLDNGMVSDGVSLDEKARMQATETKA